ncbi:Transposase [Phytophthora megakarya]|uniref:Transposase n=1 Tax=Phytophthora megakarya TaxID=4795 RepID=A0A225ULB7_9STRA|nr:Transposase [Phytophthora megakarya]
MDSNNIILVESLLTFADVLRSIVILDNAKIHMYRELEDLIHSRGSILFFLPPYSPQLNPIEVGFSLLKRWLTRHAPLAFRQDPSRTLSVALVQCTKKNDKVGINLYQHCGYGLQELDKNCFFQ